MTNFMIETILKTISKMQSLTNSKVFFLVDDQRKQKRIYGGSKELIESFLRDGLKHHATLDSLVELGDTSGAVVERPQGYVEESPTKDVASTTASATAAATDAAPAAVSSAAPAVAPAAASSLELSIRSVRTLSSPIVHATQDEPSEKRKKLNGTSSPPEPPTRDFPIFRFSFKGACCIDALLSPSRLRFRRCSLLLSSSVHPLPLSRLLFLPPVDFLATHRVSTFSEVSHISTFSPELVRSSFDSSLTFAAGWWLW